MDDTLKCCHCGMHTKVPYQWEREVSHQQLRILDLERQLAEARKDTARLDWLGNHAFTAYRGRDPETGEICDHFTLVHEDRPGGRAGIVHESFRDCIDFAMR